MSNQAAPEDIPEYIRKLTEMSEKIMEEYEREIPIQAERISKQAMNITLHHPFFSALLLNLRREPILHPDCPTMGTDGVYIYWNPFFVKTLSDVEIRGVLVHECLHPGLGHNWRVQGTWDDSIANMAMDFAINNFLDNYNKDLNDEKMKIPLPGIPSGQATQADIDAGKPIFCLDHKYDGQSFESIYTQLILDPKMQKFRSNTCENDRGDGEEGEEGEGEGQEGDGEGEGKEGDGKDGKDGKPSDKQGKDGKGGKGKEQERKDNVPRKGPGQKMPPSKGRQGKGFNSVGNVMKPGKNPETGEQSAQSDWTQNMVKAAQVAKIMGKCPAEVERLVGVAVKPVVDWATELSRWMDNARAEDYSWQHPDRRYLGSGFYLPGMYSEGMGKITIVIDTSGSVDDVLLNKFQSELQFIHERLKPDQMVVIYCDAEVTREETFERGDIVDLNPKGGGGTDFRPALDYVDKFHADTVVMTYFTDGYGSHRSYAPEMPMLWLSYGGIDKNSYPYGDVIEVLV